MPQASRLRHGRWIAVILSLVLGLAPANAQTQNRAGLIIQFGDGRVAAHCVPFGEPSITGLDLLARSGQSIVIESGGLGVAVCAMGGEGCAYPAQPCFCQCQGASCAYWNYLHLIDGVWQYSPVGASSYTITDGAVDGWAWGDRVTPPLYTIDQICTDSSTAPATAPVAAQATATTQATHMATGTATSDTAALAQVTDTPEAVAPTPAARPPRPAPTDAPPLAASSDTVTTNGPAQADVGSYAVFAIAVILLGSWLVIARTRRR